MSSSSSSRSTRVAHDMLSPPPVLNVEVQEAIPEVIPEDSDTEMPSTTDGAKKQRSTATDFAASVAIVSQKIQKIPKHSDVSAISQDCTR